MFAQNLHLKVQTLDPGTLAWWQTLEPWCSVAHLRCDSRGWIRNLRLLRFRPCDPGLFKQTLNKKSYRKWSTDQQIQGEPITLRFRPWDPGQTKVDLNRRFDCMYACMYLSIYLSIYLFIYIHTYTHMYMYVYMYMYMYMHMYTCIYIYTIDLR